MIKSIFITNANDDTLQLDLASSLDDHGMLVFNLTGLDFPKATVSGLKGPTYDGIQWAFVKGNTRQIILTIVIPVRGVAEEEARNKIYEYFVIKEDVTFRVLTEKVGTYDIVDASIIATVESVEMNHFAKVVNAVISLYCPDPSFYDVIEEMRYAEYGGANKTITYDGGYPIGVVITIINGQWAWNDGYMLVSSSGGAVMWIHFDVLGFGDRYVIDSRPGQKNVTHISGSTGVETDVTHLVRPTSEWITLVSGDNLISATPQASSTDPAPTDRPNSANLKVYLPLNDIAYDPIELENDIYFGGTGGYLSSVPGHIYDRARNFVPADTTYLATLGTDSELNPADQFTLAVWLKPNAFPGAGNYFTVLSNWGDVSDGFLLRLEPNNVIRLNYKYNGLSRVVSKGGFSTASWTLIFIYLDSTAAKMYLQFNLGFPANNVCAVMGAYQSAWSIGKSDSDEYFDGPLGPITLYHSLLTSAERTWVYNSGKGRSYGELSATVEVMVDYIKEHQGV